MNGKYHKGEIVWAKVRGFPWWPATISKVFERKQESRKNEYMVTFIGENSQFVLAFSAYLKLSSAKLTSEKIHNYKDGLVTFGSNVKQRKLIDSIEATTKILKAERESSKRDKENKEITSKKASAEKAKCSKISKISLLRKRISKSIAKRKQAQLPKKKPEEGRESPQRKLTRLQRSILGLSSPQIGPATPPKKEPLAKKSKNSTWETISTATAIEKEAEAQTFKAEPPQGHSFELEAGDESIDPKSILKDIWFCFESCRDKLDADNSIMIVQRRLIKCIQKITEEFESAKKDHEEFRVYIQGYGSILAAFDYVLAVNKKTTLYQRYFDPFHRDLLLLLNDLKEFFYSNYLLPNEEERKKHRNSFEVTKEGSLSLGRGKCSLDLSESSLENPEVKFRRKFCFHLAKALQNEYGFAKESAQYQAVNIHSTLMNELKTENLRSIREKGLRLIECLKKREIGSECNGNEADLILLIEGRISSGNKF